MESRNTECCGQANEENEGQETRRSKEQDADCELDLEPKRQVFGLDDVEAFPVECALKVNDIVGFQGFLS